MENSAKEETLMKGKRKEDNFSNGKEKVYKSGMWWK